MQEVLGELVNGAEDGLALSLGVGLGVLGEMMEAELDELVGFKHAKSVDRTAVGHGHDAGEVRLGAAGSASAVRGRGPRTGIGYTDLVTLAFAVERDLAARRAPAHPAVADASTLATVT